MGMANGAYIQSCIPQMSVLKYVASTNRNVSEFSSTCPSKTSAPSYRAPVSDTLQTHPEVMIQICGFKAVTMVR